MARPGLQPTVPADVMTCLRSDLERAADFAPRLEKELGRCFGVDRLQALTRAQAEGARIDLHLAGVSPDEGPRYRFELDGSGMRLTGRLPETIHVTPKMHKLMREVLAEDLLAFDPTSDTDISALDDEDDMDQALDHAFGILAKRIFEGLVGPIPKPYYLPADRTGVMHSHQVVVSTLIQHATTAGLRPSTDVPMLSGVLADFLTQLIDMSEPLSTRKPARARDLAARLERHVLGGAVRLNRPETGYPSFTYRPQGWKTDLPLMRASSMVSELAPVALYLRHLVRPTDLLIIEEPEAHLHPGMQAAFTRELARLVAAGIRIVMTTHSEWVLEQFGNLVRLSGVEKQARAGVGDPECALRPEQVGAWLFSPSDHPRGASVTEIELDPETGLFPTGFDEVSETLYNQGAAIFNRLQEGPVE